MKIQDPIKQLELLRDWNQSCSKIEPNNNNKENWPQFCTLIKSFGDLFDENVKTLNTIIIKLKKRNQNNIKKSSQSLKENILENASDWIHKTELWRKTKSDKKRCFDTINYLVKEKFLETKKERNMQKFRRLK